MLGAEARGKSKMAAPCWPMWVFVFLATTASSHAQASYPCVPQKFNFDSVVCVCNSTYCDNIPALPKPSDDQATLLTSSRDGSRFELSSASWSSVQDASVSLTIDRNDRRQQIIGFGGAFTDAAGLNIKTLSQGAQEKVMRSYFGQGSIGYTLARVPMGGCDFSTRPYSYDDVVGDDNLSQFALTDEDYHYKIPFVKQAQEISEAPVKVYGSPWSAPAWMKTNDDIKGQGGLKQEYYQTWADYFVKFLKAYSEHGITMWGLTMQNEPTNGGLNPGQWNCMGWTAETQAAWVKNNLGPTLRQSEFNATKVMILDDQRWLLPDWADTVLQDPETASYVDGIAVHWYTDYKDPASILTDAHNRHPDKFILMTEACEGSFSWEPNKVELGSWERAESYAADILDDLNNWVTGWVDWNIALDLQGGPNWVGNFVDSPIIVDASKDVFYKQPMFYAMGHFSSQLVPGSTVVGLSGGDWQQEVMSVAAETASGDIVVTLLNKADRDSQVALTDPQKGTLNMTLQPKSLVSVKWPGK